jgi:uncharacterized protein (AIM24 family)
MANFEIVESEGLKMIRATIENETVRAESGALHYMRGEIELESKMPSAGGFLKALVTAENFFKPTYTGTGSIYFGPPIFGEYMTLELSGKEDEWVLDQGAYVCSDGSVEVGAWRNKALTAMFGGEGWFQTKVSGPGTVVLQAQGPIQAIDLVDDKLTVDGKFAIARQASLNFSARKAAKGWIASATSGEGIVSVIEGTGRVYLAPVPNLNAALLNSLTPLVAMRNSPNG